MKPGISAIVVVRDQVDLLKNCLKSISKWVDEIIILDLESTEDIKGVADKYKAKYFTHKVVPIVENVRQESLKYAAHEYILFIDPDETIPETLSTDVLTKIMAGEFDYFVTPRQNYVFGKWVRHSRWWPDLQTRIFRHNKVSWGTKLHAEAIPSGKGFTYPSTEGFAIRHDNYRSLDEFISKNMRYAKTDALQRVESGEKFTLLTATKLSVSELISRFFQGEGYRDGMHGLILAILQSFYYFMVYAYYWEAMKYEDIETDSSIKAFPRTWFKHGLSEVMYWDRAKNFAHSIKEKLVRRMIG